MRNRITVLTLGVTDLARSVAFYHDGLGLVTSGIQGLGSQAVAFFALESGIKLALWPRSSLAADTGLANSPFCPTQLSLGQNLDSMDEVDTVLAQAVQAGAPLVKAAHTTSYGGYAGYFQDPDGHLWEILYNPGWTELG